MSFFEQMCETTGYTPKTTFWMDFEIAECFGPAAIQDTYDRAFREWKTDYIYLTELVMVMNWKIWRWNEPHPEYAKLYEELWEQTDRYALETLKDDELSYFLHTVD